MKLSAASAAAESVIGVSSFFGWVYEGSAGRTRPGLQSIGTQVLAASIKNTMHNNAA
jgi:hypothetical protein